MNEEKKSIKEQAVIWAEGLYTEVTLTDEVKEDIVSEIESIPDIQEGVDLLNEVLYVLNNIPNKRGVGKNGESSYDMASKVDSFIRKYDKKYL